MNEREWTENGKTKWTFVIGLIRSVPWSLGKNWLIISLAVHYKAEGSVNFIWFIKLAILCSFSFSYKI